MAKGYQHQIAVGNVGRDPEMRYTQAGVAVCSFTLAVNRKFGQGESAQEETTWFKVTCWNKLAELANQYVRKGGQVLVSGTVSVSAYLDKSGQPQATLELRADNFQLLGSRGDEDSGSAGRTTDEEIPF